MTANDLGLKLGSEVRRMGDDGKFYNYEVISIDADGVCIEIGCDGAFPEWAYIMADDCEIVSL